MKFVDTRPYADPEAAARKLLEIANSVEPVQDGRIHIEKMNWPLSFATLAVTTRRGHEMATQAISFEYAQSHCNRDEFCHRLNSNLLHHPTAVRLYSASVIPSCRAICLMNLPRATNSNTCRSRGVNLPRRPRSCSPLTLATRDSVCRVRALSTAMSNSSDLIGLIRKSSAPVLIARTVLAMSG